MAGIVLHLIRRGVHAARLRRAAALAAVVVAAPACDDPTRASLHLDHVEVVSGDGQTGVEGQPLPEPIVARAILDDGAVDLDGVLFVRVQSGNGAVRSGGALASGNGAAVGGPGDGTLSVEWTLGPAAEAQELFLFGVDGDTVGVVVTATAVVQ